MTFREKEILSAKLTIAENQAWLEVYDLQERANELLLTADTISKRCLLLSNARSELWSLENSEETDTF